MTLVAVSAPALAILRRRQMWPSAIDEAYLVNYVSTFGEILYLLSYFLAGWSMACLALRLRRPRPGLRRLMRQPGMVASLAAVIVLVFGSIHFLYAARVVAIDFRQPLWVRLRGQAERIGNGMSHDLDFVPAEIGCAIAVAWAIQALGGQWHPERSWIDRLGRFLGMLWIVNIPFLWFRFHV